MDNDPDSVGTRELAERINAVADQGDDANLDLVRELNIDAEKASRTHCHCR